MKKIQDHYFKKAKREGYPARSVYKLKEAQSKYRFLKRGYRVLDLGAAPGAWTKYAWQVVGKQGKVVAVDLKPLAFELPNCKFLKADVFGVEAEDLTSDDCPGFHVVLSDMAPKTTGRKDVDHLKQIALAEQALRISQKVLLQGGTLFCKVFQGEDLQGFREKCSTVFRDVKVFKPKSSRSESVELFLLCTGFKGSDSASPRMDQ